MFNISKCVKCSFLDMLMGRQQLNIFYFSTHLREVTTFSSTSVQEH